MVKSKSGGEVENGGGGGDKSSDATAIPGTSSGGTGQTSDGDNISTRVGARTKKAKVVFDPSDNYVPRKRVRKSDLAAEVAAVIGASPTTSKTEPMPPKSPAKLDKSLESSSSSSNGSNAVIKPRLTQSPVALPKPKVLGSGPSSSTSLDGAGRVATSTPTSPIRNCDMCHKVEQQRRGFKLIDCSNCAFRAHSKCLRAHPVYSKFPIQLNFRCFQCIDCVVCGKTLRGGKLLFCCDCQNAFHQNCHGPPDSTESGSSSSRSWVCKQCCPRSEKKRLQSPDDDVEETPTKEASATVAVAPGGEDFAGFSDNEIRKDSLSLSDGGTANESNDVTAVSIKEEVVDQVVENGSVSEQKQLDPRLDCFENVQNWSCDDVYRYFKHHFPDYAHLFREQEIDGPSLVLMRKSDVLSGFGLKLGPAITLYQRIVMMQNNDTDFRLTWI